MEEQDFQRIEKMIGQAVKTTLDSNREEVKTLRTEMFSFKEEIKEDFRLQVGILSEDFQHKLQLVAEGHQMLSEKLDRVEGRLEKKIDAVAADLAAHRADTEGHKGSYRVSEP